MAPDAAQADVPICTAALVASSSSAPAWRQPRYRGTGAAAPESCRTSPQGADRGQLSGRDLDMTTNSQQKERTRRWHFVDIDVERSTYDAGIYCKHVGRQGSCIVKGLPAAIAALKDKSSSKDNRLRALKARCPSCRRSEAAAACERTERR